MRYTRVHIESIGYELPPRVVTSGELEERLASVYAKLKVPRGQLEALTGISERRWWPLGFRVSDGAIAAARKALAQCQVTPQDLGAVIYAGVCRDSFEPATACRVAAHIGCDPGAAVFDVSNACLGVLNGIIELANRVELGQIRAGLVVSCESADEIVEETIAVLLENPTMGRYSECLATLTGGAGAVACVVTDGSFGATGGHRLLGAVAQTAPEHHELCKWGLEHEGGGLRRQYLTTEAVAVLRHGVALGARTWNALLMEMGWTNADVDGVICHQVGSANQQAILNAIGIPIEKDFESYPFLGNMGTVSLPLTAALATERGFLRQGHRVGFLGIGSGLNCLMLGLEW